MKLQFLLLISVIFMTGCADLIIRDEDTAGEAAGKVGARVLLGLATIGISEHQIALLNEKEEQEAKARRVVDSWNQAVGRLTLKEAVFKLGPPTSLVQIGEYQVAVWQGAPGPTLLMPGPSLAFGPVYFGAQAPGHRLELTFSPSQFDPKQQVLRQWRAW